MDLNEFVRRGQAAQEAVDKLTNPPVCKRCNDTGIDQSETDADGRLTGCACECDKGQALMAQYEREANE